jgi:dTDP-4-dehydrorhamnose reductase
MSGQPIAVIGASGQVGRALQRAGAARGADLVVAGRPVVDIGRRASVMSLLDGIQPSIVINAAAYTAVDKAETDEAEAFRVNRDGAHYLAIWCAANSVPMIHISTDYVFDGRSQRPYSERDACQPLNAYGRSKAAGEDAVRDALAEHVIVRTAWVYSTDGQNFLKTMLRIGAERDVIRVVDDQFGTPTSAEDIAVALLDMVSVINANRDGAAWGTYHLVADGHTTWHGFAREIFAAAGPSLKSPRIDAIAAADYPTPAARPQFSVLDTTEIRRAYGIALPPWQVGVSASVRRLTEQT